jgi:hypothetical protein
LGFNFFCLKKKILKPLKKKKLKKKKKPFLMVFSTLVRSVMVDETNKKN